MNSFKMFALSALVSVSIVPQYAAAEKVLGTYSGFNVAIGSAQAVGGGCPDNVTLKAGTDLDCLIDEIIQSGSNTYYYRFSATESNHWNNFSGFLAELKARAPLVKVYTYMGPEVWTMPIGSDTNLAAKNDGDPKTECKGNTGPDENNSTNRKHCNGFDLVAWATAVSKLATGHDNLAGFVIDDYDRMSINHSVVHSDAYCKTLTDDHGNISPHADWHCREPNAIHYTHEYTAKIKAALGDLKLLLVAYNRPSPVLGDSSAAIGQLECNYTTGACYDPVSHVAHYDGIVFPVLLEDEAGWGKGWWSSWFNAGLIKDQITRLKAKIPGKELITMLYATGYNSLRQTEPEYIMEAAKIGYDNSDGVVMYHLQSHFNEAQNIHSYKISEKRALIPALFERLGNTGDHELNMTSITTLASLPSYRMIYSSPSFTGDTASGLNIDQFLVAGDYNGSGKDGVALVSTSSAQDGGILGFNEQAGDHSLHKEDVLWYSAPASTYNFTEGKWAVSGDFNGNGQDSLTIISNRTDAVRTQEITEFTLNGNSMFKQNAYSNTGDGFDFDRVKFAVSGNFVGNGRDSIAMLYDYPDPLVNQRIFGFSYNDSTGKLVAQTWLNDTTSNIQFDKVIDVVAGDFWGDSKDELVILVNKSPSEQLVYMYTYNGSQMVRVAETSWQGPSSNFPLVNVKKVVAGNFDTDSKDELALYYNYGSEYKIFIFDSHSTSTMHNTAGNILGKDRISGAVPNFISGGDFYGTDSSEMVSID